MYDGFGKLQSYTASFPQHPALSGTRTYQYNHAMDRLVGESYDALTLGTTYSYDDAGNHTGSFHGHAWTGADYGKRHQFTGAGYSYDAPGNPTQYAGVRRTRCMRIG